MAAIFKLIEDSPIDLWTGTFKDLKTELENISCDTDKRSPSWPKSSKGVGNLLRNQAPMLKTQGLDISFGRHTNRGSTVRIQKIPKTQSPSSQTLSPLGFFGDDTGDRAYSGQSPQSSGDDSDHSKNGQSPQQSPLKTNTRAKSDDGDCGDDKNLSFCFTPENDSEVF